MRRLTEPSTPLLYFSAEQNPLSSPYFLARGAGPAEALARSLQSQPRAGGEGPSIDAVGTLADHVGDDLDASRAPGAAAHWPLNELRVSRLRVSS